MTPIFWTFRRCPYAMRARLAVHIAEVEVEFREILLRDKPSAFLNTSVSATVPCLKTDAAIIDESLDIMVWALEQSDPAAWLQMPKEGHALIANCDGPFKAALDRTKYHTRYGTDREAERPGALPFLRELNERLERNRWLFSSSPSLADMAILPFVRQFAFIDRPWFDAQDWPFLRSWLDQFLVSSLFEKTMLKRDLWRAE